MEAPQPLYLLADSQLLFWKRQDRPLLEAALDGLTRDAPLRAAYIGASNGDGPEFYEIFEAAVDAIGITDRRMIDSVQFGPDQRAFLERAQLIVLAGGDVRLGWNIFETTGMKDVIQGRYAHGAVLVGISAGAVSSDATESSNTPTPRDGTARRVHVHPRHRHARRANRVGAAVAHDSSLEGAATGLGIPSGGGVIVHPDTTIEPLRRPAHEFRFKGNTSHALAVVRQGGRLIGWAGCLYQPRRTEARGEAAEIAHGR